MPTINIVQPFILTENDGRQTRFDPGEYEVSDEVASHWFVKAHSDNPPEFEPPLGTMEYAQQAQKKQRRKQLIDPAGEEQNLEATPNPEPIHDPEHNVG